MPTGRESICCHSLPEVDKMRIEKDVKCVTEYTGFKNNYLDMMFCKQRIGGTAKKMDHPKKINLFTKHIATLHIVDLRDGYGEDLAKKIKEFHHHVWCRVFAKNLFPKILWFSILQINAFFIT